MPEFLCLELESHANLRMPRRAKRTSHLAKLRITKKRVRRSKARRIREVKELSANLQLHPFANHKLFAERKIRVVDSIAAQVGKISRCIPSDLISRVPKTIDIDDRRTGRSRAVITGARGNLRARHVWPLQSVSKSRVGKADAQRRSRLERQDCRYRPSTDDRIQHAIHIMSNPAPVANRHIHYRRHNKAVGRI